MDRETLRCADENTIIVERVYEVECQDCGVLTSTSVRRDALRAANNHRRVVHIGPIAKKAGGR
jgi:hypothetical protein